MNVALQGTAPLYRGNTDLITVNRIGNGLRFDGVNDYVQIPHNALLDFEHTDNFSFSVIVKPEIFNAAGNDRGIGKFNISAANFRGYDIGFMSWNNGTQIYQAHILLWQTQSILKFIRFTWSFLEVKDKILHLVFVKNGNSAVGWQIYLDGVILATNVVVDNTFTNTIKNNLPVDINRQDVFVEGNTIYDLKIFNKAISQAEVSQLFLSSGKDLTGLTGNLVANYDFNQKQGTVLEDKSPNGLNGTLTNFTNTSLGSNNAWVNSLGGSITY